MANTCDGAPELDCACIKVDPGGDDALAEADYGITPFRNVQPAIDFASSHPAVAAKVCVAATAECSSDVEHEYSGPSDQDLRMHSGISVYGGYESVGWTRCQNRRPHLALATAVGVSFGPDVIAHTVLDGFTLVAHPADATTVVTVRGAQGVELSGLALVGYSNAPSWRGVDIAEDADVNISSLYVLEESSLEGSMGEAFGVRAVGSRVTLSDSGIEMFARAGSAHAVWLEDSPGSLLERVDLQVDSTYASIGRAETLVGLRVIGGGDVAITDSKITLGGDEDSGNVQRTIDVTGDGTGTVTLHGVNLRSIGGYVESIGIQAYAARILVDGSVSATGDDEGQALGIWLEDAPGSQVSGTVQAVSERGALALLATGAGTDVAVTSATIGAKGYSASAVGVSLADCAGSAPMVSDSTIEADGSGVVQAILATGQCHARIESNERILATGRVTGSVDGIRCSGASRCVISDNADIRTMMELSPPDARIATTVACEAGSCERISRNVISGMGETNTGCHRPCYAEAYGIDLTSTDTLVERNRVSGGCGDNTGGIRLRGVNARIQNNEIVGRPTACYPQDNVITSFGVLETSGSVVSTADVHSNTIDGGGSLGATGGCRSAAVSPLGGLYRNNIFRGGGCDLRGGVQAPFLTGNFRHNDFDAPFLIVQSPVSSQVVDLATLNQASGCYGNFEGDPSDAGTTEDLPADDFEGQPRSPTYPDVGADEQGDHQGACLGQSCSGAGMCLVVDGLGQCACLPGYERAVTDPLSCVDVDECATDNGDCDPLSLCTNTPGSRTCGPCPPGYDGDGESGCTRNPCLHGGACTGMPGPYCTCSCPFGTSGAFCENTFARIVAAGWHACGLRADGSLECWMRTGQSPLATPSGTYVDVAPGLDFRTCAVRADGTLVCWGPDGTLESGVPSGSFRAVAWGTANHICAVAADDSLSCWGDDTYGQATPPSGGFDAVAVGRDHSCGVRTDGTLACWGRNDAGQATPPSGEFSQIGVGALHSCGLRADGTIACWGDDTLGQVGLSPSGTFSELSVQLDLACALRTDQTLACWGGNTFGEANPPAGTFVSVAAGSRFGCGVRTAGPVTCWGL